MGKAISMANSKGHPMALKDEIEKEAAQIRTDSYPMSVGELLNLYHDKELDVHPEFQRVFRWTNTQKTKLIESILLGIPMPPIFVAQQRNGVWDVVDGQQRLSTILQFVGVLTDENGQTVPPLVLESTKFLPSLAGKTWDGESPFNRDQQLFVKRAKIDVNIVLKESDETTKYELFMRLNTGGTALQPQEVRNCLMIMAYRDTYTWIRSLSEDQNFVSAVSLSERLVTEQYPMELVTRFIAFRTMTDEALARVGDIGEFLNEKLKDLHKFTAAQKAVEERAFRETFRFINQYMQDDAFHRYDQVQDRFLGSFSIAAFEAVGLGVGFNTDPNGGLRAIADLQGKVKAVLSNPVFIENSGSGVRASTRIPRIVPLGRAIFAK